MKNLHGVAVAAAVCMSAPSVVQGAQWTIDPAHTSVTFKVRHMMVTNVRGEFGKVDGTIHYDPKKPEKTRINATVDATTINTRDDKRDEHLRSPDFFDVAKYPKLTFKSTKVTKDGDSGLKVRGQLTMHGVTKEVVLDVTDITPEVVDPWGNTKMGATATTVVNRHDYGISWNKTLDKGGVVVGDDVKITLDVELSKVDGSKT